MVTYNNSEHYAYPQVTRHWSPVSEKYAGGDALVTALSCGWKISQPIFQEDFWHAGMRLVTVYHFELSSGDSRMTMPVITNPFVRRMLRKLDVAIVSIDARETIHRREGGS